MAMGSEIHADFYFIGARRGSTKSDRRVDGFLVIPTTGFSCKAVSGSRSLSPLPAGVYVANNYRARTDSVMKRDGVGFSVDLADKWDASLNRMRTLLRIHPDGGAAGTEGCVGIQSKVAECRDQLAAFFPSKSTVRRLEVQIVKSRKDLMLVTPEGAFIFA